MRCGCVTRPHSAQVEFLGTLAVTGPPQFLGQPVRKAAARELDGLIKCVSRSVVVSLAPEHPAQSKGSFSISFLHCPHIVLLRLLAISLSSLVEPSQGTVCSYESKVKCSEERRFGTGEIVSQVERHPQIGRRCPISKLESPTVRPDGSFPVAVA